MSIGDFGGNSNSNNNSNKVYEGTYYSRLRLKQSDSSKTIGVSFRSGLLIISIKQNYISSFFIYIIYIYVQSVFNIDIATDINKKQIPIIKRT